MIFFLSTGAPLLGQDGYVSEAVLVKYGSIPLTFVRLGERPKCNEAVTGAQGKIKATGSLFTNSIVGIATGGLLILTIS